MSVKYNGTYYYYLYNGQGDVVKLIDGDGVSQVEYTYDTWGACSVTGSLANTLGAKNPFRYRGYVYDTETRLYYLESRYYDPETGRFISADNEDVLTKDLLSTYDKNLYSYCDNNPIIRVDFGGDFWRELFTAIAVTAAVVAAGALVVATGGLAVAAVAGGGTMLAVTSVTTTALGVAVTAGTVAVTSYAAATIIESNIIYAKSKADPYARPGQKKQGRERKNKSRNRHSVYSRLGHRVTGLASSGRQRAYGGAS